MQNRLREAEDAGKEAAILAPTDTRALNYLARIAISQHRTSEALGYLQASLKIRQNDPDVWRAYGLLLQKRDPDVAWKALSQAAALETSESARWLRSGLQEMEQQHNSQGLHDIQRAVALNPDDLVIQVQLGAAARANDKPTLAAEAFTKALSISPGNIPALLGSAASTLQVDPSPTGLARAETQLQQVIAVQPSADAYFVRGDLHMQQRRYAEAVTDLKTALKMDPRRYRAHSMLSQCYSAMGQERLALSESATYIESDSRAMKSLTAKRETGLTQ